MAEGNSLKEILRALVENDRSIIGRPEELIGKVDAALKLPALKKGKIINPLKTAVLTAKIGEGFLVADSNPSKRSEAIDDARKKLGGMLNEERVNEIVEAFTYAMNWDAFGIGNGLFDGVYDESTSNAVPEPEPVSAPPASTDFPEEKSFAEMMQELSEEERNEMLFGSPEASREPVPDSIPEPTVSEPLPEPTVPESTFEPTLPEPMPPVPEAIPESPVPEAIHEPPTPEPMTEPPVQAIPASEPVPESNVPSEELRRETDDEGREQTGRRRRHREQDETAGETSVTVPSQDAEPDGRGRRRRPLAAGGADDAETSAPTEMPPLAVSDHEASGGRRRRQGVSGQKPAAPSPAPEMPQEPEKKRERTKKAFIAAGIAAVVLIGGFLAYGPMRESRYSAKCGEFVTLMTEAGASMKALGDGDEKGASRILGSAEDLASLKKSLPDSESPDRSQWLSAIEKNEIMMAKAKAVVEAGKSENGAEKIPQLYSEYQTAAKEAEAAAGELRLDGRKLDEAIPYDEINMGMGAYVSEKMKTNQEYLAKTLASYKEQLDAQNAALKGKGEVVFLAENVSASGNDVVLHGRFYNGTADLVTRISEVFVNVTLKQFDTTVAEIKDVQCPIASLSSLSLQPGTNTGTVSIALSGKAPEGAFNHFDADVQVTRFSRRQRK